MPVHGASFDLNVTNNEYGVQAASIQSNNNIDGGSGFLRSWRASLKSSRMYVSGQSGGVLHSPLGNTRCGQ